MTRYEVLEEDLRGYREGQEVIVEIRDCETLEAKPVRAIIFRHPPALAGGEELWIRAQESGVFLSQPWWIKILEEVPVEEFVKNRAGRR